MTNPDIWPLIDTALKVGMGATIAAACFGMAKLWHKRQMPSGKQSPQQKRLSLLEQISSDVGHVNHSFAKYSALVIESTRFGKRWPPARKQELDVINSELVREFERLSSAEAKLLMLGEKTMEKTLRLYAARIALFRKQVYVGRQDISEQEIADLKAAIMQLREQFYDILSRRYDKLLAA
ncbi:energy transducer TonB [Teredinibacter haidensis]|uniref:energy transducer TonB n=1 Tax=Teredinibacter haidensis TaxID=2731755 RepID=UPI000948A480|nr:energy transducer TonB [Teredinibacter haidensis]